MGGALIGIGAVLGIGSSIAQYQNTTSALKTQAQMAMQSSMMQNRMFQMQAGMLAAQSGMFAASAGAFRKQAGMFMEQSDWSVRMGKMKSAQEHVRARQTEKDAERASVVAGELRRQKVGAGMASFAGHGVSVDASSSVAMWEQDEMADLAFEMQNIGEKRDNEVWGYIWQGNAEKMQSLFDAQSYAIQAQGALINAGTEAMKGAQAMGEAGIARLQGANALLAGQAAVAQADAGRQNALWGMISGIAGTAVGAGSFFMAGGGAGGGGGGNSGGYGSYSLLASP